MAKILITGVFPLEASDSGDYCLDFAYWLYKQGHEVDIVTVSNAKTTIHQNIRQGENFKEKYSEMSLTDIEFPGAGLKDFPTFRPHNLQGFKIYFRDLALSDLKSYLEYIKSHIRTAIESNRPDVIICNHVTPQPGLIADIFEELGISIPVIQIEHGPALSVMFKDYKGKKARESFGSKEVFDLLFDQLIEKGKSVVTDTIAVSENAVKMLKKAGYPEATTSKRPKGLDPEIFQPSKSEIDTWNLVKLTERGIFQDKNEYVLTACCSEYRNYFGFDYLGGLHSVFSKKNIFIFAGSLDLNDEGVNVKGVDLLIDASVELLKTRSDFGVIVCGNGNNFSKLISKAYSSGLENMFFVGDQDHSTVIPLWNNYAVAGVYPSRAESYGMVAVECAACGTVPITTNSGPFKDIVKTIGGTIVPMKPVEIAKAMNAAIEENWSETRADKFKKVTKYSWAKIAKDIDKKIIQKHI